MIGGQAKEQESESKNGPTRNQVERKLVGKKITFVPSVLVDIFGTCVPTYLLTLTLNGIGVT